MLRFFAACPRGLENLLYAEIKQYLPQTIRETVAGVSFSGDFTLGLKACLYSRIASRIVMIVTSFYCQDESDLYLGAAGVSWEDYFSAESSIKVDFNGSNRHLRSTLYSALKVKDAICDRFYQNTGKRPDVDKKNAMVRVHGLLKDQEALLALDISGTPLFMREHDRVVGAAPLKENLAAAMLMRAGYQGGSFLDPMCGSGTLLMEAAAIATDSAPGLARENFGFMHLKHFDAQIFAKLKNEAATKAASGREKFKAAGYRIIGFDEDENILKHAALNIKNSGFEDLISLEARPIASLKNPFVSTPPDPLDKIPDASLDNADKNAPKAESSTGNALAVTIVTNPPYGQRLGNFNELIGLYHTLGAKVKELFPKAVFAVISSSLDLLSCLHLSPKKSCKLYNGPLLCHFQVFNIEEHRADITCRVTDFKNRLAKNLKHLAKWASRENIDAYRLYDADLGEYNAAVDKYGSYIVIQEYQAPKSVPEQLARRRFLDLVAAVIEVTKSRGQDVILKEREHKKGSSQYEKLNIEDSGHINTVVHEGGVKFHVNITDYLDTGLFLDARLIRGIIKNKASGKSFLNLFAYTATASVMAVLGGASRTLSVDLSRTYLEWGMRNFALNNLNFKGHDFLQADCLAFLSGDAAEKFDLIYVDPPTFSNSKRMEGIFDIKRDHVKLLANAARFLNEGGEILFCTNKRGFKPDIDELKAFGLVITDLSGKTIPEDFKRNSKIHHFFALKFFSEQKLKEPEPLVKVTTSPKWSSYLKPNSGSLGFTATMSGQEGSLDTLPKKLQRTGQERKVKFASSAHNLKTSDKGGKAYKGSKAYAFEHKNKDRSRNGALKTDTLLPKGLVLSNLGMPLEKKSRRSSAPSGTKKRNFGQNLKNTHGSDSL